MTISGPVDGVRFNRSLEVGDPGTGVALWQMMFPRIDEIGKKMQGEYVAVVDPGSSLGLDDRYLGTWRNGGLHVSALNAAYDSLVAIRTLLETGELPMTALYPMLRAAIENASLAIYLLESKDRDERLLRSYRIADDDAKWRCVFATETGTEHAWVTRMLVRVEIEKLIKLRPSLGDPRKAKLGSPKYGDMVELAEAAVIADPAIKTDKRTPLLAWWQLMSGVSHGKAWAMIAVLERSEAIVDEENETAYVKMTSSTVVIGLALMRAVEVLETALRLYGQRSKATWAQPEDATEPARQTIRQLRAQRRAQLPQATLVIE
jgi:hypothetical protein